ncbi:hypothetical protein, variant [Spizellomyces punctatus DAOM BR117]|uniref:BAG domain-containing protein n=1 Tax=Spizellomyces punctatus (strain DAOM BR117) TaxID=645134 RepID=A0A0L0H386_SPIPD|nr:hypothetical protein, variant [Spizellomyces punctatus DAOM BR117]KNC95930.1 hypothetical protein, variant [Spizellomyces punctatus DAOM BR117]|eukprot:XP_016603970.1 hypothetical protein, variant [Spizellomyces punctatus DAOM BR117]
MSVTVNWKGKRFDVPFREEAADAAREGYDWTRRVTLGDLLEKCSRASRVPRENIKLLHSGAIMKDPAASLSDYGIRQGSKIMMIGDKTLPPEPSHPSRTRNQQPRQQPTRDTSAPVDTKASEEASLIDRLESHLADTRNTVLPIVEDYTDKASRYIDEAIPPSDPPKSLRDLYAKASELLLQSLLKLDGVTCPPDFENARAKRKEAVRFVQSHLDRIDGLKERVNLAAKPNGSL